MSADYTFEQLVELITREVMAAYPPAWGAAAACTSCAQPCNGQCVSANPDAAREVVAAGATRLSARLGIRDVATDLAALIDHTLLRPDASEAHIRQLCAEARQYNFASVCINPTWVELSASLLRGARAVVCTVIGFPLGATLPEIKRAEAERVLALGAREVDMVINIGALKSGHLQLVLDDIAGVVSAAQGAGALTKVIIETALLSDEEKVQACILSQRAGADFVKTSTGFASGGATAADVALMRRVVGPEMGVKASGGIKSAEDAEAMVKAGATRLGASAGVRIVQQISGIPNTSQPAPVY